MRTLYELIDAIPNSFAPNLTPQLQKLYVFAVQNKDLTDKEVIEQYLGDITKGKSFYILKTRLKKALMQHLIASSSSTDNKDKAMLEDVHKMYSTYKLFLIRNKRETAIDIAKSLLPKLRKLELHHMAHIVANDLYIHYSVIHVSPKQRNTYGSIAKQEFSHASAFTTVQEHYGNMMALCNTKESYSKRNIDLFIEIAELLKPLLHKDRHTVNRFIYIVIVCRYMAVHDYKNMIRYSTEALDSFPENHPNIRMLSFMFLLHKVSALTALGLLLEAKEVARQAAAIITKGSFNWHLVLIKRIVVCLHSGDYQEAYQLYNAHKKQVSPYPVIIEHWNIIKGYIYVLKHIGLITPYKNEHFRLGKFINEMPIYSKDKAGNNINILIIQILVQMKRGQYISIIERMESMQEYVRTYTKSPESKRANIFMKMILKMGTAQFHRQGTENKTRALHEKLIQTPLRLGQNLSAEVIPYEVLWEEILNMLDSKFRGRTTNKSLRKINPKYNERLKK